MIDFNMRDDLKLAEHILKDIISLTIFPSLNMPQTSKQLYIYIHSLYIFNSLSVFPSSGEP